MVRAADRRDRTECQAAAQRAWRHQPRRERRRTVDRNSSGSRPRAFPHSQAAGSRTSGGRPRVSERVGLSEQREKLAEPGFVALLRLGVKASGTRHTRHLLVSLRSAPSVVQAPGVVLRPYLISPRRAAGRLEARRTPRWWTSQLNARELAAVIGWPVGGPANIPGLKLARSRPRSRRRRCRQ